MSGDRTQAQQLYKTGRVLYGEQRYEEALSAFDRALSLGDRGWKVMDAKAAAMNKMGGPWRQSALEVARNMTRKFGKEVHQTWYRLGVICVALELFDEATSAAKAGLAFCPTSAYEQYETLTATITTAREEKAQAQAAAEAEDAELAKRAQRARTNYTHLLNSDVLLCVAEFGLALDPNFALRLAGVCRDWRSAVLQHRRLWSCISLTRRRPLAKLATFSERCGGRVRQVSLRYPVHDDSERVALLLRPHIRNLEKITFDGFAFDGIVRYTDAWRGQCRNLREIVVKDDCAEVAPSAKRTLFFGLLSPDSSSLRKADLSAGNTNVYGPSDMVPWYGSREWLPNPAQLSNLRHLRLRDTTLHLPLHTLLALMPALEWAELDVNTPRPVPPRAGQPRNTVAFTNLKHLHLGRLPSLYILDQCTFPALESLSVYKSGASAFDLHLARFPHLRSLDLGFCHVAAASFAKTVLAYLRKLQFLNLSGCAITNSLLEELVVHKGSEALCPDLVGLSLAVNDEIGVGPVRRIVLSRNLGALEVKRPEPKAAAKSPFAPAPARAGPFAPKSRPASQASSLSRQSSTASLPSSSAPEPPATKAITSLVLDHCHGPHMDAGVLQGLRRYVRFVSYSSPANVDEDRIRGRGAYDWTKVKNLDDGCHLRKREREDGWYVHHTCKAAKT